MAIQSEDCTKQVVRLITETHADVHLDPLLMKACQKDIGYLCGRLVPGRGQIIECLQVKFMFNHGTFKRYSIFCGSSHSFFQILNGNGKFFILLTTGFREKNNYLRSITSNYVSVEPST